MFACSCSCWRLGFPCPDVSSLVFLWESHTMAPLLPLHPCGLTRVKPLSEGRFIHVWCLPVGSFARSHVELWGGFRQSKERLQVPKEQEAGAAEQDLSSSCSAPHAGIPTSHPGLQSSIHMRAAPCSLQAWSCFLLSLLANVWLVQHR